MSVVALDNRRDPPPVSATETCHGCGRQAPRVEMLRSPAGAECMACSLEADALHRAKGAFRRDLGHGAALLLALPLLAVVATLSTGVVPGIALPPWGSSLVPGLAAGYGVAGLIWGGWAVTTGGDRRLEPGSTRRHLVRAVGALVAASALGLGLASLALVSLAWLA